MLPHFKNFIVPQWALTVVFYVALLNSYYGKERIDAAYLAILWAGNLSHEKKMGNLTKIPNWLYYAGQTLIWFYIIYGFALSLYGPEIDNWLASRGL